MFTDMYFQDSFKEAKVWKKFLYRVTYIFKLILNLLKDYDKDSGIDDISNRNKIWFIFCIGC